MTLPFQVTLILPIILTCASFCMGTMNRDANRRLNVTYEWKYVEYYIPESCDNQEAYVITRDQYDYTNNIIDDVQPLRDGRVLLTTPRFAYNPSSLSTISDQTGDGGPLLSPYPSWSWHNQKDCSGITSVNRVFLDDCNRLWVVDTGKIGNDEVCPAKILLFDPDNDELTLELEIPNELAHNPRNASQGRLEATGVETHGDSCERTVLYMGDVEGFGLVIWDGEDIWRLDDQVYYPDPHQTNLSIAGENFTLSIGLTCFYINPPGYLKIDSALFKPLSSVSSYGVNLKDLHNSKTGAPIPYFMLDFPVPSQETAGVYSKKGGILIASFSAQMVVACWNIQYPLAPEYIVTLEVNETTLQFVDAFKTIEDPETGSETVWLTSNRFQRFARGTVNFDEINFRIMTGDIDTLVKGTLCEPLPEHDVKYDVEDKRFFYYKTAVDTLVATYPLHRDTDNLVGRRSRYTPREECSVNETPATNSQSQGCRLVRKRIFN